MAYPEVPLEIRIELDRLRISAAAAFQREDWETAARLMDKVYGYLLSQQERYGTRFHKGWELHNGGVVLIRLKRFDEGIQKIFPAYVEDALSAEVGDEDTIDGGLAGSTLKELGASEAFLNAIKLTAKRSKDSGQIRRVPEAVFEEASSTPLHAYDQAVVADQARRRDEESKEKRSIEGLRYPFHLRCFVGASYFSGGANLEEIKKSVGESGFDAIFPLDFAIDQKDIHHRSLLLLHLCKKAIFEVTNPGGQLMELERCRDYGIAPLLVRSVLEDQESDVSAMVSGMIVGMAGVDVRPYKSIEELHRLVRDYLQDR